MRRRGCARIPRPGSMLAGRSAAAARDGPRCSRAMAVSSELDPGLLASSAASGSRPDPVALVTRVPLAVDEVQLMACFVERSTSVVELDVAVKFPPGETAQVPPDALAGETLRAIAVAAAAAATAPAEKMLRVRFRIAFDSSLIR